MNSMPTFFVFVMVLGFVGLGVWIWALVDALGVPNDSDYRSGTKLIWVIVIVFAQVIGAVVYFAVGRPVRRPPTARPKYQSRNSWPPPPPAPPGARN